MRDEHALKQGDDGWQDMLCGGQREWVEHWDHVWADEFPDVGKKASPALSWSFCQVVDEWKAKLHGAYACLRPHSDRTKNADGEGGKSSWPKGAWFAHENVPKSAYEPTAVPYFVSYDRGTMHSLWTDTKQKVHLEKPGVPVMQIIMMPPRGHDLHQIVEHCIGVGKGHARKKLGQARVRREKLTTKLAYDAFQEGISKFEQKVWHANFARLMIALKVVRTRPEDTVLLMKREPGGLVSRRRMRGTGGNYAYMQCS